MLTLYDIHGRIERIAGPTAVTVGVFDGVHQGHQQLLKQLAALNSQFSTLAVTLTAHPSFVLGRHDSEYWLDDPQEHLHLLLEAGAKYVAELPFTREVAACSACQMARFLFEKVNMRSLFLGYDSRFGSRQDDDFDRLPQLAAGLGFALQRGEPFLVGGQPISSSRIRSSLAEGRVADTAELLGRPYTVRGTVVHGRGVGHTLGFPTANIDLAATRKMLPREGVYAVRIGSRVGMANLGTAPTFGIDRPLLEVHLLDFEGDLYGQQVAVEFVRRLRDTVHFDTVEALEQQLEQDLDNCRKICRTN